MYKIIAMDADGTLLTENSQVSEENKRAIKAAQRLGINVVICSGRAYGNLEGVVEKLELDKKRLHIVSFNGGAVFNGVGEKIHEVKMDKELALYVIRKIRSCYPEASIIVYTKHNEMLIEKDSEYTDIYMGASHIKPKYISQVNNSEGAVFENTIKDDVYKVIVYGPVEEVNLLAECMKISAADKEYDMVFSSKKLLEFSDVRATKAEGLNYVCNLLDIDIKKEAIAIGDHFNDLSMIKEAALGVCMANGEDGVKKYADYVTEKNNHEDGVAEVINKFILERK